MRRVRVTLHLSSLGRIDYIRLIDRPEAPGLTQALQRFANDWNRLLDATRGAQVVKGIPETLGGTPGA